MAEPHANPPITYSLEHSSSSSSFFLMSSDSSLYKTKIREGVLGLTTGSTKDLTRLIIRAFLGGMPMAMGIGEPRAEA